MSEARPSIVGPESPEAPYPIIADTYVISGFGRGSTELGFPTANILPETVGDLATGVYYGWAVIFPTTDKSHAKALQPEGRQPREPLNFGSMLGTDAGVVYPMVMSVGWNPFYQNERKSAEVYVMHEFPHSFYGARIKISILGFIRDEKSYKSLDALIEDIKFDCEVAMNCLKRPGYEATKTQLIS